jgi:hypothetical protein
MLRIPASRIRTDVRFREPPFRGLEASARSTAAAKSSLTILDGPVAAGVRAATDPANRLGRARPYGVTGKVAIADVDALPGPQVNPTLCGCRAAVSLTDDGAPAAAV